MVVLPEKYKAKWEKDPDMIGTWNELSDTHKEGLLDIYARVEAGTLSGADAKHMIFVLLLAHEKEKYEKT